MKFKDIFFSSIFFLFIIIICDLSANLIKLRPLLWKNSFYSYLNVGWYTYQGADNLFEGEIHSNQTNQFKTRGKKYDYKNDKVIILLGDSYVETSRKFKNMPERFLEKNFNDTSVISFGSYGWGNDQQLVHLKKHINDFDKPTVVLWYQLNDFEDNLSKHGFLGSKPTYKLLEIDNEFKLKGPHKNPGKNYFEYSYFYRAINKIILRYKLNNSKSFIDNSPDCSENKDNYNSKKDLLSFFYNEKNYEKEKKIFEFPIKSYGEKRQKKFLSYRDWVNNSEKNFLAYNKKASLANGINIFNDKFKYNRINKSENNFKHEKLNNLLITKIRDLALNSGGKFFLLYVYNNSAKPFPEEKDYLICHNGKEIKYSNRSFFERLNNIFFGIENKLIFNIEEITDDYYNLFDSHYNDKANEIIMKKLAEFIEAN